MTATVPVNPLPSGGPAPDMRRQRLLRTVVVLMVVLVLALAGIAVYVAKFGGFASSSWKTSFDNGATTSWQAGMPAPEGERYVEPLDDKRLMVVDAAAGKPVHVYTIQIGKGNAKGAAGKGQPAQAKLTPVTHLPHCSANYKRMYSVRNGHIICAPRQVRTLPVAALKGVTKQQQANLGQTVDVAGKLDGATIAYSRSKLGSYVVALSKANKLLWSRYYDKPITVSAAQKHIWVSQPERVSQLSPVTRSEGVKQNAQAQKLLTENPIRKQHQEIYDGYANLLANPNKAFKDSSSCETYKYGFAKLDTSGVPAMVVRCHMKAADDSGDPSYAPYENNHIYYYAQNQHKLLDVADDLGTTNDTYDGSRLASLTTLDNPLGIVLGVGHGVTAGELDLYQIHDGKIVVTKHYDYDDDGPNKFPEQFEKRKDIKFYPVSDLEPLRKAVGLPDDVAPAAQGTAKPASGSNLARDRAIAEAKKAGKTVVEGTIKIMSVQDAYKMHHEAYTNDKAQVYPPATQVVMLIPDNPIVLKLDDGSGPPFVQKTTRQIDITNSADNGATWLSFKKFNNEHLAIAFYQKDLSWPTEMHAGGNDHNHPQAIVYKGAVTVID